MHHEVLKCPLMFLFFLLVLYCFFIVAIGLFSITVFSSSLLIAVQHVVAKILFYSFLNPFTQQKQLWSLFFKSMSQYCCWFPSPSYSFKWLRTGSMIVVIVIAVVSLPVPELLLCQWCPVMFSVTYPSLHENISMLFVYEDFYHILPHTYLICLQKKIV
jgi:hypothetical protein